MVQNKDNLTQEEAQKRASLVSNVHYKLKIDIKQGSSEYGGTLDVSFKHKNPSEGVFLDYKGKAVRSLSVNGVAFPAAEAHKDNRVHLTGLKEQNTVVIEYVNDYDHDGDGFHRFVDPEDNQEYFYTNFEPFYAHRLLPCFDQPDLKAPFELSVISPASWEVVSNAPEKSKGQEDSDKRVLRQFEPTPVLSTYLYAIVAGPFDRFDDKYENMPLGLFCRKSLSKYFDTAELFETTKQGLKFYRDLFGFEFPFVKYDQLFVPEFNVGAMENFGCVTFTEHYVFRDPPTSTQRLRRAETLLHEMAHMWFGDLVSPIWWDGLWLNESFATFISSVAQAEGTNFSATAAWHHFHSSMKAWAYREDQLSTTHAIQGAVPDTNSTFQNFDGITYGKGAAVLKQLVAVVGREGFRDGLRIYFKKHQWGNTTIEDFLSAIEEGAKRDLKEWSRLWLQTAGLNTIIPRWTTEGGKIKELVVEQLAPAEHPTLRPHHLEVAIYGVDENNNPKLKSSVHADIKADKFTDLSSYVTSFDTPIMIYCNYNDHAYVKCTVDEKSLSYVLNHIEKFDDTLQRQLLWSALWNMVRDAQFSGIDYLNLIRHKITLEPDIRISQSVLRNARGAIGWYIPSDHHDDETRKLFHFGHKQLLTAKAQDDRITFARLAIDSVVDPETLAVMTQMAENSGIEGFQLDQDMRWSLVHKKIAFNLPGWENDLQKEKERDPSDRGKRAVAAAESSVFSAEVKEKHWQLFLTDTSSSLHTMSSYMRGFHWHNQKELLRPYLDKFFDSVVEIFRTRNQEYANTFYSSLFPYNYRQEDVVLEKTRALLQTLNQKDDGILIRNLKESIDDLTRSKAACDFVRSKK